MFVRKTLPHAGVSSKEIQKARKNAQRIRTAVACSRCKAGKIKCTDYRPCKNCARHGRECSNMPMPSEVGLTETIDKPECGPNMQPTVTLNCHGNFTAKSPTVGTLSQSMQVNCACSYFLPDPEFRRYFSQVPCLSSGVYESCKIWRPECTEFQAAAFNPKLRLPPIISSLPNNLTLIPPYPQLASPMAVADLHILAQLLSFRAE
jgi:hypothetical protein